MAENDTKIDARSPVWLLESETEIGRRRIHWRISTFPRAWRPPTDVYVTEDAIIVRVEIAGMSDGEFVISLDGQLLTIRGIRPDSAARRAYHQMEIHFGEFRIDVELPWPVDADGIDADYNDGFLSLVLPRLKPHHIEIQE